jgi:hydroxyethylthiazole kinase-like uncharacterized protein yjeF
MMKINKFLTSQQIYQIDKLATEKFLIPSFVLMENAGRSVAEFVKKYLQKNRLNKILIFCGPGKNGGDGFVCARYLFIWGFKICVVTFVDKTKYSGDTLRNYEILERLKVKIQKFDFKRVKHMIKNYYVIIDAIFGIGLSRPVEGEFKSVIEIINNGKKPIFSIDIPSGLNADTGEILGCVVKPDYTLTIGFPKYSFKLKHVKPLLGKLKVIDIGYPVRI